MAWFVEKCSCCGRMVHPAATIGTALVFCLECRPDDLAAYQEDLITGPWPPPILAPGWRCPHGW
jgi:hypothetical protein